MSLRRHSIVGAALAAAAFLLVAGCASPYGREVLFGGFREDKLSDNSYRVMYAGNGYTNEDMVVKYWLHRCAEITQQQGFTYFGLVPGTDKAEAAGGTDVDLAALGREGGSLVPVRGGGAPTYIWVPSGGGTSTRYSKRGVIVMYHSRAGATTEQHAYALHAPTVTSMLKAYVESQGQTEGPTRREVIDAAMRHRSIGDGL